jgi:hypothetical protein
VGLLAEERKFDFTRACERGMDTVGFNAGRSINMNMMAVLHSVIPHTAFKKQRRKHQVSLSV